MLCTSITLCGQEDPYRHKAEQKAIKAAYNIIRVYYSDDKLCISDSVYNFGWAWSYSPSVDNETAMKLGAAERKYKVCGIKEHYYSESLSQFHCPDTCTCSKLVAFFAEPYKGMITCDITTKDRPLYMTYVVKFRFRYNDKGEIYQFTKYGIHVD